MYYLLENNRIIDSKNFTARNKYAIDCLVYLLPKII